MHWHPKQSLVPVREVPVREEEVFRMVVLPAVHQVSGWEEKQVVETNTENLQEFTQMDMMDIIVPPAEKQLHDEET